LEEIRDMALTTTVIRLAEKPKAEPTPDHFKFDTIQLPSALPDNHVILKALWISVDPYIRGQLWQLKRGSIMTSPQIAQVIESNSPSLSVGDIVTGTFDWSTYSVIEASPKKFRRIAKADEVTPSLSLSDHLGPLGLIGVTAYQGLFDIGALKKGENVFVSGAAGAVGSIVGQIAKHVMGCRVVGTAGSDAKCRWLRDELGFDVALNYKNYNGDVRRFQKDLKGAFGGKGVDVFFDNVGGFQTEAIWDLLKYKGRVVVCGQIANYNRMLEKPRIEDFLYKLIYTHIRVEGFSIHSFKRYKEFNADMARWMKEGKVQMRKTVKNGLAEVPEAFMGLFTGQNFGKMLVKISEPQMTVTRMSKL